MVQKAVAMGNWSLVASSQQCAHSHITNPAEFFGKTSNHPGDSAPLQPRFVTLWLLAFPKTKITFETEKISDCGCLRCSGACESASVCTFYRVNKSFLNIQKNLHLVSVEWTVSYSGYLFRYPFLKPFQYVPYVMFWEG